MLSYSLSARYSRSMTAETVWRLNAALGLSHSELMK